MATDVTVKTCTMELRTCKLTKSLLKQLPIVTYSDGLQPLLRADGNEKSECVVGWVHGSVLGDEWKKWLILKTGEGQYARYDAMDGTCKKYPQIFIV